jgi:uncharacterized membrane protein YedE/YeeE
MNARTHLVALGSGLLFGAGLAVSGLTRPEVVIGFLDVTGRWDPTLGVVMAVATAVNTALIAVAMRRGRPLWARRFSLPRADRIDRRLVAGAAIFGIGWGLVGVCPGPALASLASGETSVLIFVASMTAGLLIVDVFSKATRRSGLRRSEHLSGPKWPGIPLLNERLRAGLGISDPPVRAGDALDVRRAGLRDVR